MTIDWGLQYINTKVSNYPGSLQHHWYEQNPKLLVSNKVYALLHKALSEPGQIAWLEAHVTTYEDEPPALWEQI